ncbi:hypothetical protein [Nesterenkonia suensis]
MGERLDRDGRAAVRTPMQGSAQKNGGFSAARPSRLSGPPVEGPSGPAQVTAADARRDGDCLRQHVATLSQRHRESPELSWGEPRLV